MLPLAVAAVAGLSVAVFQLVKGPNLQRVAAGLGWPVLYVQTAAKSAKRWHVPLEWVLATIIVESRGNPRAAGDADGRSVGLMQVNAVAHAQELAAAGLTRTSLFDPVTNIEWGTKYLAQFKAEVERNLGGRPPPIPIDQIIRLSYKGPATVYSVLRKGGNPGTLSWAHPAVENWQAALARVTALTRGSAVA